MEPKKCISQPARFMPPSPATRRPARWLRRSTRPRPTSRKAPASTWASTIRAPTIRRASGSKTCWPSSKACRTARFSHRVLPPNTRCCMRSCGRTTSHRPARCLRRHLPPAASCLRRLQPHRHPGRYGGSRGGRRGDFRRTRLVWLESPTNPRLIVSDIPAIAALPTRKALSLSSTTRLPRPSFSSRSPSAPTSSSTA